MCFKLEIKDLKITKRQIIRRCVQIAAKDIKVYKVVDIRDDKTYRSYFQQFVYTKGFHYTEIGGFSYTMMINYFDDEFKSVGQTFSIHRGFHSYIKRPPNEWWHRHSCSPIVKVFYIPKGARYFKNDEEYVSDQIVLY